MGRSVLTRGQFARRDEVPPGVAPIRQRDARPLVRLSAPDVSLVRGLLNRTTVAAFNELWYRKAPSAGGHLQGLAAFFHPLDGVPVEPDLRAARLRAVPVRRPFGREEALREARAADQPRRDGVLPRRPEAVRGGRPGMLSFPRPAGRWAWTSRWAVASPACSTGSTSRWRAPGPDLPRQGLPARPRRSSGMSSVATASGRSARAGPRRRLHLRPGQEALPVIDARIGRPLLLVGGTSDIAVATARRYC